MKFPFRRSIKRERKCPPSRATLQPQHIVKFTQCYVVVVRLAAIGCPPLDPPPKAWMKSIGEHAVIRCNETEEAWYLTCRGTEWIGQVGNCSEPMLPGRPIYDNVNLPLLRELYIYLQFTQSSIPSLHAGRLQS